MALVIPVKRAIFALLTTPAYRTRRSLVFAWLLPVLLSLGTFLLPLPHTSVETGVVWIPDDAVIRVSNNCDVTDVHARPGTQVEAGQTLFTCHDPDAQSRRDVLVARVDELEVRRAATAARDPLALRAVQAELKASLAALEDVRSRMSDSIVTARLSGIFDIADTAHLKGRAFSRGDLVGYVVPSDQRTVRLAIDDRKITRFDSDLESVALRIAGADGSADVIGHQY
jgi:putative peptide zinc metalloprotease protein